MLKGADVNAMKRLIMVPGQMDDVFCMKELKYLVKKFDEVHIFPYPGEKKSYEQIAHVYNVKYYIVKDFTLYSITRCFSPKLLRRIGFKNELKRIIDLKKGIINTLSCMVYVFLYINFALNAEREYRKINQVVAEDYLYGCWMSRGAFACSFLHQIYKNQIDKSNFAEIKNCVVKAHGYDLYEERRRVNYIPFRRYIYENMENMYFISQKGCDYYKKKYGWNPDKFHVCHLGTDKASINKSIRDKKAICIVSCSSAWKVKRLDIIIDVIANLDLEIQYVHLGDGPLFDKTKEYARKKLSGKKNITYVFLGRVDNYRIYEIYDKYDVDFFINMSDSEGLPVSIMEANAFGIPTICRDIGGNPEIVSEKNGLVVHFDDNVDEVAKKIEGFIKCRLEDINKYRLLSGGAQDVWYDSFNASQNYSLFADEMISYEKRNIEG